MNKKRIFITYIFCIISILTYSQEDKYCRKNRFHPSYKLEVEMESKFRTTKRVLDVLTDPMINTKMNDSINSIYEFYKDNISVFDSTFIVLKSGLKMSISPFLPPEDDKIKKCTEEFKNRQKYLEFCQAWKKQKRNPIDLIDKYYKKIEFYNQKEKVAEFFIYRKI